MRLTYLIAAIPALAACASDGPSGPAQAASVNPVIEQRIEDRVHEGRAGRAPELNEVPSAGPALPTAAELRAERDDLLAEQVNLDKAVEDDRQAVEDEKLKARADQLLRQIERDRALAKAEGMLSVTYRPDGTAEVKAEGQE